MIQSLLYIAEGYTIILNHVNSSRNHLNSLLESWNQEEILESGIIISMFLGYVVGFTHYESHNA